MIEKEAEGRKRGSVVYCENVQPWGGTDLHFKHTQEKTTWSKNRIMSVMSLQEESDIFACTATLKNHGNVLK